MIIDISKSKIFTSSPDIRFSKEYALPRGCWDKAWLRYKAKGYTGDDLRAFIFISFGRRLTASAILRWVLRSEIYSIANPLRKMGVTHVNTIIFNSYEDYVLNELVKPLKNGAKRNPKSII